jgi:peroxiredoxin Q/BCP
MSRVPTADFRLPGTGSLQFDAAACRGRILVIYFYPKDNTPGCTTEGQDFAALHAEFQRAGAEVFGISRDSVNSHEGFKKKLGLPFELLADVDERVCEQFGVMKLKNMYGKQVRGVERSTFVFDRAGKLAREWRAVKVPDHARDVLAFVKTLA